jgi:hypothetical protein
MSGRVDNTESACTYTSTLVPLKLTGGLLRFVARPPNKGIALDTGRRSKFGVAGRTPGFSRGGERVKLAGVVATATWVGVSRWIDSGVLSGVVGCGCYVAVECEYRVFSARITWCGARNTAAE